MPEEKEKREETPALSCAICLKEIDASEAETYEVDDYVHHFCGLDCYSKWQEKKSAGKDRESDA